MTVRLHLGCGEKKISDFTNIDIRPEVNPDLVRDVTQLPEKYKKDSVDLIYSCHNLEHVSEYNIGIMLLDWNYILVPGGELYLSVPDFEAVCEHYIYHKDIKKLNGLVLGGQKNAFDHHYQMFDFDYLNECLKKAHFENIERYDRWKTDWAYIDDYSAATLNPPFSRDGKLMSLNVKATKKVCIIG